MVKKKSTVFMVLLTIVIVVLTALTIFPAFAVPGTVKKWNPVVLQYDFGADFSGGSYAYYYPEGVISETEYQGELKDLQAEIDAAKADGDTELETEKQEAYDEYVASYVRHKGLRLSTEEIYGIFDNEGVSDEFKQSVASLTEEIAARYEQKGYSDYRVAVVDNCSVRIELPLSESNAGNVYSLFATTGEVTLSVDGELVDELKEETPITDLIRSISVDTKYKMAYLKVRFTAEGREMIERVKETITNAPTSSSSSESKGLDIKIGDETIATIYKDSVLDTNKEARVLAVAQENKNIVETYSILLNSALYNAQELKFDKTKIEVRTFQPVYGENAVTLLYIALGIALLAILVLPIVKMNRFGVISAYSSLSYLIIVGICFKYITDAVFEITLGSVLIFLLGLVVINVLQYYVYGAIIERAKEGKTMASAAKEGYKKTLWTVVDIYAVLLLGALALLLGFGGLNTFALQAIICVVAGAFISLLWSRFMNFLFFSASKNHNKYYRFKREVSQDDD